MRPILLESFLLQLFYPYPPQMSFYYAVCPWYGHHLPKLEAITKRERKVWYVEWTSTKYIRRQPVLHTSVHQKRYCKRTFITCSAMTLKWLQVFSISLGCRFTSKLNFSCIQFCTTKKNLPCSLILLNYISWKMDLGYLKNGMVWMVYSHFLHKRSQSKLYNPNTDVKTKSHFSKRYERKK